MKKILKQIILFGCLVVMLAVGIGYFDLHVLAPNRVPPCDPATLPPGRVCLHSVLEEWGDRIIWIDARSEDAFERGTIRAASVFSIRMDGRLMSLLEKAMPALLSADEEKKCVVIFCDRNCSSSDRIAALLGEYQVEVPIFVLEGGWDEIKKNPELAP